MVIERFSSRREALGDVLQCVDHDEGGQPTTVKLLGKLLIPLAGLMSLIMVVPPAVPSTDHVKFAGDP